MRILISGATGFVGRVLCRHLAAQGDEVWAFSRRPAQAKASLEGVSRVFAWNAATEEPGAEAFDGVDAVVHLAGESVVGRWTTAKREKIRASRVDSTQLLVAALAKLEKPPATLISASAIGYYGEKGEAEVTEESGPDNDFLGQVAVAWEAAALRVELRGVRVVCLRLGIILGQGGGALEAMLLPFKLGVGGPLGSGQQWWSWVALDDVIGLIDFALRTPAAEGPLNVTAPQPERQKDFAKALGKALHRPAFMPAPAFALKLALGGFSTELLSSKKVLPKKAERLGYRFRFSDLADCLEHVIGS
ncbi:MAG: TIGR01777 family oxidoreductase [Acidobacteria bacterium]|nr:TIGR01777 family oxidoreductase [Acidobacteriota bacterium]MDA1236016.1 TIGR01777 family oxidoreductase [Acidobacteriota bacterium]